MIENTLPEQTQVEDNSLKKTKISSYVRNIDLTSLEEEEGRSSPVPVTIETGNDFQNLTNGSNGNLSSSLPPYQPSNHSAPSSSAILLSSIIALSSLSDGSYVTPFMNQLYKDATCLPESMIPISIDIPIFTSDVSTVVKNPLHIPSISSMSLSVAEETSAVSSSPSKISTMQVSLVETTIPNIPSAPKAIPS